MQKKDRCDENGVTPLCVASQSGHAGVVKVLYDAGASKHELLKLLAKGRILTFCDFRPVAERCLAFLLC